MWRRAFTDANGSTIDQRLAELIISLGESLFLPSIVVRRLHFRPCAVGFLFLGLFEQPRKEIWHHGTERQRDVGGVSITRRMYRDGNLDRATGGLMCQSSRASIGIAR